MMKLVIDRERWLRGEGAEESKLLRSRDGKMCCFGFLLTGAGMRPGQIVNRSTPVDATGSVLSGQLPASCGWTTQGRSLTKDCLTAMQVNDATDVDDATRERLIGNTFRAHGIDVTFV